jgi:branched-chain amino acid transport system ATP-binding protein
LEALMRSGSARDRCLLADRISLAFGGNRVLDDVSIALEPGLITGLIGPNGAGKTSLFNCLSGLYRAQSGGISFLAKSLDALGPAQRAALGIARSFQNLALCPDLSVLENVLVGLTLSRRSGWVSAFVPTAGRRAEQADARQRAMAALGDLGIASAAHQMPVELSPGTLRLAEIARAIVSDPKVILLDEPAAGLNAVETRDLMGALRRMMRPDLILLIVEHDMDLIMRLCQRIYVLNFGKLIATGTPDEVRANPDVVRIYLGQDGDD